MKLTLKIHRQDGPERPSRVETHEVDGLARQMSLLDVLDLLNTRLVEAGEEAVAVESDCREGICGACGITVDGRPHGPAQAATTCQQRLTSYSDGDTVELEPFRSASFPVLRDLVVDRRALDRIISAGGHVAVDAGTAPEADAVPIPADEAELSLDFAACIGCGACVAACPNGAAHLFAGSKLEHLALLPHGKQERSARAKAISTCLDAEFGPCSLYGECAQVCPKEIPLTAVAAVPKQRLRSVFARV